MKYVHIIDNKLLGWYDDLIHSKIPTPNIQVSDEVWQEAININANYYENGEFIVKDFRTAEEIAEQELKAKIAEAKAYLLSTDFKMLSDYDKDVTEIKSKRAEARDFIRDNDVPNS